MSHLQRHQREQGMRNFGSCAFRSFDGTDLTGSRFDSRLGCPPSRWLAVAAAVAGILNVGQAFASDAAPLAWFAGAWQCVGQFESNGKPIAARVRFDWNESAAALVKHHDDREPNAYHAVELWSAASPKGLAATIVDAYSGARQFTSAGWANESFAWTRVADAKPVERFLYVREADDRLRIEWATSRDGSTFQVGDTLSCKRDAEG